MSEKKNMRNYSLDILKFFCALLVVFAHVLPPYYMSAAIEPLRRCAVPLFFMMSGYLTYGKPNITSVVCKRMVSVFKIFCWAFLLYSFFFIVDYDLPMYVSYIETHIVSIVCFNDVFYAIHLWYLLSYIYVLGIVWCVAKYNLYKWLYAAIPFLIVVALLLGKYHLFIWDDFVPTYVSRNFLFMGLPFFALGMLVKRYELLIRQCVSLKAIVLSVGIFYLMGLAEIRYLDLYMKSGDMYFSTTFMSVSVLIFFLFYGPSRDNILSKIGREDSLYIYVFHLLVAHKLCDPIFENTSLMPYYPYFSAILVFVVTILLVRILRKIKIVGNII